MTLDDRRARTDDGVVQRRVWSDAGAGSDARPAVHLNVRQQGHVGFQGHVDADPGCCRIDDRHAGAHPRLGDPVAKVCADRSQLDPVVDPEDLVPILRDDGSDAVASVAEDGEHVGEVLLALHVVPGDRAECLPEQHRVERIHAAVDLADRALGLVGILVLDDRGDVGVVVAQHPAVTGRVVEDRSQHRGGVISFDVLRSEGCERAGAQQRCVAGDHDDGAVNVGQRVEREANGMTRAVLLRLHHRLGDRRDVGQVRGDRVPAMPDDNDQVVRIELLAGRHHVTDQTAAADRVQDLRHSRLHPGALAGGQHDHRGRSRLRHCHSQESNLGHDQLPGQESNLRRTQIQSLVGPADRPPGIKA